MFDRQTLQAEAAAVEPVARPPVADVVRRGRRRRRVRVGACSAAALLVGAAVWTVAATIGHDAGPRPVPAVDRPPAVAFMAGGDIFLAPLDGTTAENLTDSRASEAQPTWSPDGERLAFARGSDQRRDIYVLDLATSETTRLTSDPAPDGKPEWSPDGTKIAFLRNLGGNEEVYVIDADGGNEQRVTNHPMTDSAPTWAPDGERIAFARDYGHERAIVIQRLDGSEPTKVTTGSFDSDPAWSPDGSEIAFVREIRRPRPFQHDLFVVDVDGGDVERLTYDGASQMGVSWFPDGDRLLFYDMLEHRRGFPDSPFVVFAMDRDGTDKTRVLRQPLDWFPEPALRP